VIQEGITVKGKSLREHFETHNHDKAIDYLYAIVSNNYTLRNIDILSLHGLVYVLLKMILLVGLEMQEFELLMPISHRLMPTKFLIYSMN